VNLTFIVSTGRCGSTLLSEILHKHPDVLSMSEFFISIRPGTEDLPDEVIDGRRLWDVLSSPEPSLDAMVRDGWDAPNLRYPYGTGQFDAETGIPRICHVTLPMLTDDPDALFADLAREVPTWPIRPSWEQIRALFAYLAKSFDRRVVAERTAGTVMCVKWLRAHFPDARFVYLHRNGPSCALSMSKHYGPRLMALMEEAGLLDARKPGAPFPAGAVDPRLLELMRPPYDVRRIMAYPAPSLATFGKLWARQTQTGVEGVIDLDGETLMSLSYEDLVGQPQEMLARLAEFLEVPSSPEWLAGAQKMIDSQRGGRRKSELDTGALADLESACEPGARAIARITEKGI
jgi:Sulfotransferase family